MNAETLSTLNRAIKPAHVPDHLVYDFDFVHDPGLNQNPHQRILELLNSAPPIFWTPRQDGHWVMLSHSANFESSRLWRIFSSEMVPRDQLDKLLDSLPPGTPRIPQPIPLQLDPPKHSWYRAPLNKVFAPSVIAGMLNLIRTTAEETIGTVVSLGSCEFMSSVAQNVSVGFFLNMMGMPKAWQAEYVEILRQKLAGVGLADPSSSVRKLIHIASSMRETLLHKKEFPEDDIISLLWKSEIDNHPPSIDTMEDFGVMLFLAGLDTVMNAMGYLSIQLGSDLNLQGRLREEPSLIGEAVDESLRIRAFVSLPRRIGKDSAIQGIDIKKDERALLYLPAANLDASVFEEPGEFRIGRDNSRQMAFNAGPHRCVGLHLARAELIVVCEVLLKLLPPFRLNPERPPTYRAGYTLSVIEAHLEW